VIRQSFGFGSYVQKLNSALPWGITVPRWLRLGWCSALIMFRAVVSHFRAHLVSSNIKGPKMRGSRTKVDSWVSIFNIFAWTDFLTTDLLEIEISLKFTVGRGSQGSN
jgi:hypothetical protein